LNKSISIIGCGWLGMPLGKELIKFNNRVKGSTRSLKKIEEIESLGITGYAFDISSIQKNHLQILNSEILIISITSKSISDFKALIEAIKESSVKKVLFISSTSVYNSNNRIITEQSKTNNSILNQIEQLFIESTVFKTTILRFGGLFGGERKPGNFIKPPYIIKNPEGFINLIHKDDCIRLIIEIIKQNKWNEIYNACSSEHPKRKLFYSQEVLRVQKIAPTLDKDSTNDYKIISNEKIKKALNYQFTHDRLL
jgi:hypothetical protein